MSDTRNRTVLIVSDDAATTRGLLEVLASRAIRGCAVRDAKGAAERLRSGTWDLVIIDLQSPALGGMDVLTAARRQVPELPLVAIGAAGDVELAVAALRHGAQDLLTKPLSGDAFGHCLDHLLPAHPVGMADAADSDAGDNMIAGDSGALLELLAIARRVAPTSAPVLLTGESGTGKELVAAFIHRHSRRSSAPYIRINCAALSESLLESELFGHERGAFTGAVTQRMGKFERANGGTLLLDEISETSPRLQAQLLRVLEQQEFERVGGCESIRVNVRIIATSNRDLSREVDAGRFRRDLYYRLGGVHLVVMPLRSRKEDIGPLVWHFVNQYSHEVGRRIAHLDGQMLRLMSQYSWPGNVRQLRNVVRTALILGSGDRLSLESSPALVEQLTENDEQATLNDLTTLSLQELERRAIFEALRRTQSHQARAAKLLGITDRTLREKLRRYRSAVAAVDAADAAEELVAAEPAIAQGVGEDSWISQ